MTKFISLTDKSSGTKLYVNPSAIELISKNQNSTVVTFHGGQYKYIEVSESPETILIRIAEETNG